jgi:hypothetical protein
MPRDCYGNYGKTEGFPCILCEDAEECKTPIIKEGSKLIIYINSDKQSEVEAMEDMKIQPNCITILDGMLLCTDSFKPTEKVSEGIYKVNCWWQDCFYMKDGKAYKSASNA